MVSETALLSEQALAEDWNRPEEDEVWLHLQSGSVEDAVMQISDDQFYVRVPAKVLGCLSNGKITVVLFPPDLFQTHDMIEAYPIEWLPFDLRMPNSEFDMLLKFPRGERVRVLRKDEVCPEMGDLG